MTKENKKRLIMTSVVILIPMLIGVIFWNRLPEKMVTHFDTYGEPNGWSSKPFAVFGLPLFLFVINIICAVTTETDPRRSSYPQKMMKLIYWIPAVVSWVCAFSIYGYSLGLKMADLGKYTTIFMGVVFFVIGNYLPKVKQNYFLGIKLPWTYADEDNWNKTHRLAGYVWVTGGILMIANFFLGIRGAEFWLLIVMVAVPIVYSWIFYMKKNR